MQYILIFFFLLPKQLPDPPLYPTTHLLKTLYLSLSLKKNEQNLKKKKKDQKHTKWRENVESILCCPTNYSSSWGLSWSVVVHTQCLSYFFTAMMEYHDQQQLRELWWLFLTVNVTTSKTD